MEDKVSVIIPSYNNESTIEETLQSIQSQTYLSWEAIVVDDGSTDSTVSVVQNIALKDGRIILIRRETEERGGSVCRNIGLRKSTGRFVMFLDADDLLTADCLVKRVKVLKDSGLQFVIFTTATFGARGIIDPEAFPTVRHSNNKVYLYLYAGTQAVWHTSSTLFKKSFVESLSGFDTRYKRLQDVEFHFRAIAESKGVFVFQEGKCDSLYRITESDGIKYKKYYDSLSSYRMISERVTHYVNNDIIRQDILLSYSYLLLCVRYIRTVCLLNVGDNTCLKDVDYNFEWFNLKYLNKCQRIWLNVMIKTLSHPSLCLRLCKMFDYTLRKGIVARCS